MTLLVTIVTMTLTVAVDGSALGNPGPAGWAWVLSSDCWDAGGWDYGTNNLGELTAVQQILIATQNAGLADEHLHLLADSQYAINVITKWMHGWKKRGWTKADKKPIANLELIQDIDRLMEGRNVTFEWVRGHAGHPLNELADDRAREAASAHQNGEVAAGGPGFSHEASRGLPRHGSTSSPVEESTRGQEHERGTMSVAEVRLAQKELISAWLGGDSSLAQSWQAEGFERIWPDGSVTDSFVGSAPPQVTVGRLSVILAGSALIIKYPITWENGSSIEVSVWADSSDGPRIVHHQSTLVQNFSRNE